MLVCLRMRESKWRCVTIVVWCNRSLTAAFARRASITLAYERGQKGVKVPVRRPNGCLTQQVESRVMENVDLQVNVNFRLWLDDATVTTVIWDWWLFVRWVVVVLQVLENNRKSRKVKKVKKIMSRSHSMWYSSYTAYLPDLKKSVEDSVGGVSLGEGVLMAVFCLFLCASSIYRAAWLRVDARWTVDWIELAGNLPPMKRCHRIMVACTLTTSH